jgi:DNA (cytosine-5)-methyltransferase 1
MGLPDDYELPANYNEAYQLAGDGLVVPAVAHFARHVVSSIAAELDNELARAA